MPRIISNNLGKFLIALFFVLVAAAGFMFLKNLSAQAQEQIKILPESFEGDWQNAQAVFSQDLGPGAVFKEFNIENSAYTSLDEAVKTENSFWARIKNIFKPEARAETSACKNGANQACGTQVGTCQSGLQICEQGVWGDCIGSVGPTQEICDQVDNNCNSQIDEGGVCQGRQGKTSSVCESGANRPCGTETGACKIGVQICSDNAWGGCFGGVGPSSEICDGVDNDCNSKVDDSRACQAGFEQMEKSLVLSGFSVAPPENSIIKMAQLRLSLAGQGEAGDDLTIDYFYQNQWHNLAIFNLENEVSNNLNVGYFLYGLPVFENWEDLKDLKIRFRVLGVNPKVYLDALWLDVDFDRQETEAEEVPSQSVLVTRISSGGSRTDWKSSEEPEFDIKELDQGLFGTIRSIFTEEKREVVLTDPLGSRSLEGITVRGNRVKISNRNRESFRPGVYKLEIKTRTGGEEYIQEEEFAWGVLAINVNKSIYLPGEQAYIQMGALRYDGHTLCNANLKLEITPPSGSMVPVGVAQSGECAFDNVTDVPDYLAYYQPAEAGVYQMRLTNLDNGYQINDSFEVRGSVPFDIERTGPTRIYPPATYSVTLSVNSHQDFKGFIEERVPAGFEIFQPVNSQKYSSISQEGETKIIRWEVSLLAGEQMQLGYHFNAPDLSPYLYLIGPLTIGDFQEIRQWQIASDYPISNGILAFSASTGTGLVAYKAYASTTGFSATSTLVSVPANTVRHVLSQSSPISNETITGIIDDMGGTGSRLTIMRWASSTWNTEWVVASNASTTFGAFRSFGIGYYGSTGTAMVVYSHPFYSTSSLNYRTWDPSAGTWSATGTITLAANSGSAKWVEVASFPTVTSTQRLALGYQDNASRIGFAIWNGNAWGVASTTDAIAISTVAPWRKFDVALENSSGDAMVFFVRNAGTGGAGIEPRACVAGCTAWTSPARGGALTLIDDFLDAASSPAATNTIAIVSCGDTGTADDSVGGQIWYGTQFITGTETDPSGGCDGQTTKSTNFPAAVGWTGNDNTAFLVHPDNAAVTAGVINYATWISGAASFTAQTDTGNLGCSDAVFESSWTIEPNPSLPEAMVTRVGTNGNICQFIKRQGVLGTTWSGVTSDGDLAAVSGLGVDFSFFRGNAAPNMPTLLDPAHAATTSTSPTFNMRASDFDTDNISYRVSAYSGGTCSGAPIMVADQAISSNNWTNATSTCTNNPTACYTSGGTGEYATTTVFSALTTYSWKAAAKDPDGSSTFTTSTDCFSFTTEAAANNPPTISSVVFHNGVAITLEEWAAGDGTTTATTTFTVTDNDGWDNISTTSIFVYRSGIVSAGNCSGTGNLDINNCYPATSSDSGWSPYYGSFPFYRPGSALNGCAITATTANTATFWCTTTLYYVAEATDVSNSGYDYSAQAWTVFASSSDKLGATDSDVASIEMNTTKGIVVSPSAIDYATIATLLTGGNTGANWVTTTATTSGNVAVDIHFDGGYLISAGKAAIPSYYQKFTTTTYQNYTTASNIILPTSTSRGGAGQTHDLTMAKPTTTIPGITTAELIFWGIAIPTSQMAGTYTSTTNFTATSTIINP